MHPTTPTLFFLSFLSFLISTTVSSPVAHLHAHIRLRQLASTNSTTPTASTATNTHLIQEGDTLDSIAAAAGVGVCDLAKENGIKDPNIIRLGAVLTIPTITGVKDDTSCLTVAA